MNTGKLGDLGEAKVIARLTELGYNIFVPLSSHCKYDLIAEDTDGRLLRVSVKTTSKTKNKSNSYAVGLKQTLTTGKDFTKKEFILAHAVVLCFSLQTIKEEMEKCDVVCAVCHRLRTKARRQNTGL